MNVTGSSPLELTFDVLVFADYGELKALSQHLSLPPALWYQICDCHFLSTAILWKGRYQDELVVDLDVLELLDSALFKGV